MKTNILLILALIVGCQCGLHGQTQAELNNTSSKRFAEAQRRMEKAYLNLKKFLEDGVSHSGEGDTFYKDIRKQLVQSQEKWVSYRDSFSRIYMKMGGSSAGMNVSDCEMIITNCRTSELEALLQILSS